MRPHASRPPCRQRRHFWTSPHNRPFTSSSATISLTRDTCSEITTRPMTMTLPSRHLFFARCQARTATQDNLSAVTVLNLLQKCVVHFCGQFNIVTGASAPPRPAVPPLPSSSYAFANRAPPSFRSRPGCASPTGSTSPFAPGLAPTPSRTPSPTSTSRLCPNYDCTSRSAQELSTRDIGQVFNKHLTAVGFPHLRQA